MCLNYYDETLAIIPAFSEKDNIVQVIEGIQAQGIKNILVIDDCSTDNTKELAEKAHAIVIRHSSNLGVSLSLQTGYRYAYLKGYKYVVQLDGDGQHDPCDIHKILTPLYEDKGDLIIGSRFMGVGNYEMPKARKVGRALFIFLTKLFAGLVVADPTSGYKAMKIEVCKFFTSSFYPDEYPDADILILAHRQGFRIVEIGVSMRQSNTGKSIHNGIIKPVYYILRMVLGIILASFYPMEKK